ncbi:MAG: BamA/TamA family outer membrane protein [Bacteroidota bacterium]
MQHLTAVVLCALLLLPLCLFSQDVLTYEIAGLEVMGCQYTSAPVVRQMSGMRVGDKVQIPGPQIAQAIRRLLNQQLFASVEIVETNTKADLIWLTIEVAEAPILKSVSVSGLSKAKNREWKTWLDTYAPLQSAWLPAQQAQLHYAIATELQNRGYTPDAFQLQSRPVEQGVALQVVFEKQRKQKLKKIHWQGVSVSPIRQIEKAMGISALRKPTFNTSWRTQARATVIQHYRDLGHVDAIITQDSSWQENGNWQWALTVAEGLPYKVGSITWKGAEKYDPEFLQAVLGIYPGDPYRPDYLDRRLHFDPEQKDISGLYMDQGHLFFRAEAITTSLRGQEVDIEIRMTEGPVAMIREVRVEGNERTNEHVIRRELRTQPGTPFSREEVLRSQRALIGLGYFDPETLGVDTEVDPETGMVDLVYQVEEQRNDKFELAASLNPGSGDGLSAIGTLGFTFNNFSMREFLNGNWRNAHGDGQQLSIRAQSSGPAFQSYNFNFLEPWFKGKPQSFGFSLFHQRFTDQDSLDNLQTLSVTGGNLRLGQRLPWGKGGWTLNSELGYQYIRLNEILSIDLDDGSTISSGRFNNLYLQLKLAYNTVNDPFFPRRGSTFSISGQWTPPWRITRDAEGVPEFNRLAYHKYRVNGTKYIPLGKKAVLKTSAKMGWLLNYGNGQTPPFERFELGGNGMAGSQQAAFVGNDLLSLRGYDLDEIPGSTAGGGAAFAKFTAELRYPLLNRPAMRAYVLGFAEAGNSWKSVGDFNPLDTYRSAGLGLRLQVPMFGTIGFDYGLGFDQPNFQWQDWQQHGRFNLIFGFEPE